MVFDLRPGRKVPFVDIHAEVFPEEGGNFQLKLLLRLFAGKLLFGESECECEVVLGANGTVVLRELHCTVVN